METADYNKENNNRGYFSEEISSKRRVVETLIGAVFIILLVLMVSLATGYSGSETETTITNSFNTYNTAPVQTSYAHTKPYIIDTRDTINYPYSYKSDYYKRVYARVYHAPSDKRGTKSYEKPMAYNHDAQLRTITGALGNDIDKYEVYVKNKEYVGGYFKVIFYFEDYYGQISSYPMIEYIPAREEKLFLFKDISPDRYKYADSWYKIEPLSETPIIKDYN